jgi:hypothetical protein
MHEKLKILRMEFSICTLQFENDPEIYANEIDELVPCAADFLFPSNGNKNAFGEYYTRKKRDWLCRFYTQLRKRIDWRLNILNGSA